MTQPPDLNEILVFVRVAEQRSLTKAGQLLGLPKSTISRKLSQLEDRLGVSLVQRTTRTLSLTDAGQTYLDRCARIIADLQEADSLVASMQAGPSGTLRVSAPPELGNLLLDELACEYLEAYPDVSLELDLSQRQVDLVAEGFDLAVRVGTLPDSTLVARRLAYPVFALYASPSYLASRGVPQKPADLAAHDCLVFTARPERDWHLEPVAGGEALRLDVSGRAATNSMLMLRDLALGGFGIALMAERLAQDGLAAGKLTRVLADWQAVGAALYAVYPGRRFLAPKAEAFLELLLKRLAPR